mgnify:CR=1 FL=1
MHLIVTWQGTLICFLMKSIRCQAKSTFFLSLRESWCCLLSAMVTTRVKYSEHRSGDRLYIGRFRKFYIRWWLPNRNQDKKNTLTCDPINFKGGIVKGAELFGCPSLRPCGHLEDRFRAFYRYAISLHRQNYCSYIDPGRCASQKQTTLHNHRRSEIGIVLDRAFYCLPNRLRKHLRLKMQYDLHFLHCLSTVPRIHRQFDTGIPRFHCAFHFASNLHMNHSQSYSAPFLKSHPLENLLHT